MKRRDVLVAAGVAAAASVTSAVAQDSSAKRKPSFLLVHGSWHGAWCYAKILPHLINAGHMAAAVDLPGHGLSAQFPKSYSARPLDAAAFATELSPLAQLTLDDYAKAIGSAIDGLMQGGSGPVILLGHSMGGMPITAVGEAMPEKIRKLIYLTAFLPASGTAGTDYLATPEAEGEKVTPAFKADPTKVGVLRLDPNSTDPAYIAQLKAAFAGDVSDAEWAAICNLLTPDDPVAIFATPLKTTRERWGRLPRAYIRCTQDCAIRIRQQDKYIALADAFVPNNKTEVVTFETSHSPFMSKPAELAAALIKLAS
jgi:pimeloyl-ACP methyl ester carboxylesterase